MGRKSSKRNKKPNMFFGEMFFNEFVPQATLDFHGLGPLLHYDIEKMLEIFIEDSYMAGLNYVLVITGNGRVVKPLCMKLLKKNKYVKKFNSAGYFNGQGGAVEVTL